MSLANNFKFYETIVHGQQLKEYPGKPLGGRANSVQLTQHQRLIHNSGQYYFLTYCINDLEAQILVILLCCQPLLTQQGAFSIYVGGGGWSGGFAEDANFFDPPSVLTSNVDCPLPLSFFLKGETFYAPLLDDRPPWPNF